MKLFLSLAIILNLSFLRSDAQDTLRVKGIFMSQIERLEGSPSIKGELGLGLMYNQLFSNYLVQANSFSDYYNSLHNKIYITSSSISILSYEDIQNILTFKVTDFPKISFPDISQSVEYPTNKIWRKVNKMNAHFYIIECDVKCIPLKKVKLKVANLEARKKKDAFVNVEPMVYFITEIISMHQITEIKE